MKIPSPFPRLALPAFVKRRWSAFTLIELLVVISIIAILAGIALPVFSSVQIKGAQTKDLSNAKQVALGLRLYAQDNNGSYPTTDPSGTTLTTSSGANGAFANLVPQYIPQEKVFFLAKSAWNTRNGTIQPGDEITTTGTGWTAGGPGSLSSGENNFAYVSGLNDSSNPSYPLVADGFTTGQIGTYDSNQANKGGVWFGKAAVVIRADSSGSVEKLNSSYQDFGVTPDSSNANIFLSTQNWITSCQVFNPI